MTQSRRADARNDELRITRQRILLARADLQTMPQLLHAAHDDTLVPTGARNDTGIRSASSVPPEPRPGDPSGWETYRWGADQLVRVMRLLEPSWTPPQWHRSQVPSPYQAGMVARAILASLTIESIDRYGHGRIRKAAADVGRVRTHLSHVAGALKKPLPPGCDTPNCLGAREHGNRCYRCVQHKHRNGEYPDIRVRGGRPDKPLSPARARKQRP